MVKKNILGRKLGRDMWKSRMQFVAVILLCALGSWCFSGLDALWRTIDLTANTYFDEGNVADLWVNMNMDREALETLRNFPDVEDVQARFSTQVKADLPHEPVLQLEAYDGVMRINVPRMVSGEALEPSDLRGCLLDDGFARANGLGLGDKLTLKTAAGDYDFWIRGTCQSAEYLSDNKDTTYDPLNYGFVLLSAKALPTMPLNQATIILKDRSRSDQVEAAVSDRYPAALIVNRDTQRSSSAVQSDVTMFHNLCYLFPLMAFAVAAMIVLTTITRMMENQRLQMGTLKALGFHGRQIRSHYMCYALYPSLIGSLLGLFVGRHTLPSILWELEMAHFQFPYRLNPPVSWSEWLVTGLGVLLAVAICYRTYRQSGRETTAQLLRPKPPKAGRKLLLERFPRLWSRMGFNAKMVTRNLMRNKGRSLTSLVGVLCCTMLIITSMGLQESVAYSVGKYYNGTLAYTARANLTGTTDQAESYGKRIEARRVEAVM
ncbi:MAG: ABC transporter permease, partial [Eubacteriales bacterium]|nr:ABC transporter permease [Eubacteriales bacterium]